MALQVMSATEIDQVSGATWDAVDWLSAGASAAGALLTGGFGWVAFGLGAAVEAVGGLPANQPVDTSYWQPVDQDTMDWETSGYYD